jgi:membrane-bound ClpP family serine protease
MKSGWSSKTVIRYALYQVPSLVLLVMILLVIRHYIDLSLWIVCGIVLLWMVKDAILFPFVWRAYDRSRWGTSGLMIGKQGIAEQRLDPSGYVRIHGELWKAKVIEGSPPIEKGEAVWVEGMRGLVLRVRPEIEERKKDFEGNQKMLEKKK